MASQDSESQAKLSTPESSQVPGKVESFGSQLLQHFNFDPKYRNMNNGSYGTFPKAIRAKLREYQDLTEARPDPFIRYEKPKLVEESREAIAEIINVPKDTVVLVPNATMAINVILRNLTWADDCKDEILCFSTIYGGCGKTVDYIVDSTYGRVSSRTIPLTYPVEDAAVVSAFEAAVAESRAASKRPRACVFDTVSSLPGVRFPFEAVAAACRAAGVLSVIDGAQGVGMVHMDIGAVDPDFFLSNCHKWLHVPRGCAVLHVPLRNQHLVTSTVPTSHGYVPKPGGGRSAKSLNPLPAARSSSPFVAMFETTGTIDSAPYYCVTDAVRWRRDVLGGEARIIEYTGGLARSGGARIADILGTRVLENAAGSLGRCSLTNVELPLGPLLPDVAASPEECIALARWMERRLVDEYATFVPVYPLLGGMWVRVSAEVFLELADFEWLGATLLELCERVKKGEHKTAA